MDVACRAAELVDEIRPVRNQAAFRGEVPSIVNPRQSVTSRQSNNCLAMNGRCGTSGYDYAALGIACEGRDSALNLVDVARNNRPHLPAKAWRHCLNCTELSGSGH